MASSHRVGESTVRFRTAAAVVGLAAYPGLASPEAIPDSASRARAIAAANAAYLAALPDNPVRILVTRLDLEKYRATIRGLTQFGDRRQRTERNRNAVAWIEAQLKSHGCVNTDRLGYQY